MSQPFSTCQSRRDRNDPPKRPRRFFFTRKRNQKLELEARDPWIRLVQMGEHWILDIDVDRFVGYYIESIDVFFSKFAVDLGLFGF